MSKKLKTLKKDLELLKLFRPILAEFISDSGLMFDYEFEDALSLIFSERIVELQARIELLTDPPALTKSVSDMSTKELNDHNDRQHEAVHSKRISAEPSNMTPMPTEEELLEKYTEEGIPNFVELLK